MVKEASQATSNVASGKKRKREANSDSSSALQSRPVKCRGSSAQSLAVSSMTSSTGSETDYLSTKDVVNVLSQVLKDASEDEIDNIRTLVGIAERLLADRTRYKLRSFVLSNEAVHLRQQQHEMELKIRKLQDCIDVRSADNNARIQRAAEEAGKKEEVGAWNAQYVDYGAEQTGPVPNQWLNSQVFTGSLSNKPKADLEDIARALGLLNVGQATRFDLVKSICAHLEAHPELKMNARFTGLFRPSNLPVDGPPPFDSSFSAGGHMQATDFPQGYPSYHATLPQIPYPQAYNYVYYSPVYPYQ
ncbi:hypothetical protein APHAL10511_005185 [Amanita phalloides]|nr:hypothetical protein APHAL10511_005185 [Amanita phalloides]